MPSLPARVLAYLILGAMCTTGALILLIAAGTGIERALFIRSSLSADGAIVAFRLVRHARLMDKSRNPVFRFTAKDGRSFTVTSNVAQSPSPWRIGDRVRVLYQQEHPEKAHIDSFVQLWAPQVTLGIVGGTFSTIPLLIFFRRRRSKV
jgi:hypothetical protein